MHTKLTILIIAALAFVGCTSKPKTQETMKAGKIILYYSQTGITKQLAGEFAKQLDCEAVSFDITDPYNGSYQETIDRCLKEMEGDSLSPLAPLDVDLAQYDTVLIGFPVWFGTYARPVMSLLKEKDFAGKVIIPFCTFGSGGTEPCVQALRNALPKSDVRDGFGIRAARIQKCPAEVERFLIINGMREGQVEDLPEYSTQQPLTPEEADIFQQACGSYPMPIGTPVSVGNRETSKSKDYLYTVNSVTPQGDTIDALVYVTIENGEAPDFTHIVR